jgi:hypothetical protein
MSQTNQGEVEKLKELVRIEDLEDKVKTLDKDNLCSRIEDLEDKVKTIDVEHSMVSANDYTDKKK